MPGRGLHPERRGRGAPVSDSMGPVTEADVFEFIAALPGVAAMMAGDIPAERRFPFATIVVSDYPGFDTASRLDRPDIFRVNIHVGPAAFTELFGYSPCGTHTGRRSRALTGP